MPTTPGKRFRLPFRPVFRSALALWSTVICLKAEPDANDAWQAALNLDYNAAASALELRHDEAPGDPRTDVAYAASLLVRDPVTTDNVARAGQVLETLLATLPATDNAHRPLVLYLLARIAHDHEVPSRLETALARYRQLRAEYPGHALADQAAVHLGYILSLQTPDIDPASGIAAVEPLLATVATPGAKRELHYLLAHLHWHGRRDAAAALPHFIAGREIGFEAPYRNGEVDLTIAGLAAELGRDELAARHYLAFVNAYPRDARAQTARRLAEEARARLTKTP